MSQVSVTINGRVYRMACDDGQEDYLVRLARELDLRIQQLRETFGEIGDTRLAVTAAIMLADEVSELRKRMRATEQEIESLHQEQLAGTEKGGPERGRLRRCDRGGGRAHRAPRPRALRRRPPGRYRGRLTGLAAGRRSA